MNEITLFNKIQLRTTKIVISFLNFGLKFFRFILFPLKVKNPQNILIYKIGNIGDIVCAVPSFIAVRKNFPEAKITLLTSPGIRGAIGAKELLDGVKYLDELKVYYSDNIDSFKKKRVFVRELKRNPYDLFIQLPDDLANFRTLLRNMFFAKAVGAKSAFGFEIRTIQLFKKTQVDYTMQKTEVESLLDLLRKNGIKIEGVEYDFNISEAQKKKAVSLLKEKWGELSKKEIVVAVSAGGKREANQWPIECFVEVAKYLESKYYVKIIVVGGSGDIAKAEIIRNSLSKSENILITAGKLDLLETFEMLKYCSFLISNDTGAIHMAAAISLPVVGIYSVRNVFGRWFPYGLQHKILYHKFLDCNYKKDECIKKSIKMTTVEEVKNACEELIQRIKQS